MVVVSFGGSLIGRVDLQKVGEVFSRTKPLAVVVGGGRLLEDYVRMVSKHSLSKYDVDRMLIHMTYINSYLLKPFVKDSEVFYDIDTASLWYGKKRVLMGGTHPGHTTDTVAALLCEKLGEKRMINITDVDGVYDRDPKKFEDAKKYDYLTYTELEKIISDSRNPRSHTVIDILALKILERSGIELWVIDGTNLNEIKRALSKRKIQGTIVSP